MNLTKSLRLALNILLNSKLRSWLTIVGIVIGVAAIIAIISIGSGFEKDVQSQLGGLGSDVITIVPGFDRASECPGPRCHTRPGETVQSTTTNMLTHKELQALRSISDLTFINSVVSGTGDIYYLGRTARLTIEGVDPSVWKYITTATLDNGRLLGPGDTSAVVIGSSVAHDMFKTSVGLNRALVINGTAYTVVGILKESGGFGFDDKKIFMPISTAKKVLHKEDTVYDSLVVKVRNQDAVDAVQELIEKKLMVVRHVTSETKDFTVISMKAIQQRVAAILAGFTLFLGVIATVSLLVGAVGIANTMFTAVLERTKEIGIMKALGAQNRDILLLFLFNSGLVGLVGGMLGVALGIGIALLIPRLGVQFAAGGRPLTTAIHLDIILYTLLFSLLIGMISGIIPAYRASKLKPVDALRSE